MGSLLSRLRGPKERIERGIVMLVERAACSRAVGYAGEVGCGLTGNLTWTSLQCMPKARKAAYKWEGNMIRFIF